MGELLYSICKIKKFRFDDIIIEYEINSSVPHRPKLHDCFDSGWWVGESEFKWKRVTWDLQFQCPWKQSRNKKYYFKKKISPINRQNTKYVKID